MTVSTGDKDGIKINSLDICTTEIRSKVGMNSLGITGSSMRCERATEKGLTVDSDGT